MSHIISTTRTEQSTPRQRTRRWSDRSVASTLREIVLMATMFMLYRQVRSLTSGDVDQAMVNADRVVGLERSLGAFSEGAVQRLVLHSRLAIEFLDHYYVFVHFTASFGFMAWVFLRHPEAWGRIRSWFLSVTLAGLVIHVLFPLAPPRMLSDEGFVDTLHVYGPSIYSKDVTNSAANQLAAMPSLHFAWAAIIAAGVISMRRSRWTWLIVLHPVVTLLAIVATANHYWADATVGGILVAVAVSVSSLVKRPTPAFAQMPAYAQAAPFTPGRTRFVKPTFVRASAGTASFTTTTLAKPWAAKPAFATSAVEPPSRVPSMPAPARSFAQVPMSVKAPAFAFSSAFASAARFAQGPMSGPLSSSLPPPPPSQHVPNQAMEPTVRHRAVVVEPAVVEPAVLEPAAVRPWLPVDRLRISRFSTITAVPVIVRETPGGRRHDLTGRRARSTRSDRCRAACDLPALSEPAQARSVCAVNQTVDSRPV
jgi:PAP2 superfamily